MSAAAVAHNYAETLLELAARDGQEERYGELLATVAGLFIDLDIFRSFLDTPGIPMAEKQQALREVLSGQVPPLFINFLLVVVDKRRQRSLPAIEEAYRDLLDKRAGRVHATVRLAFEPDDELRAQIVSALSERLGANVVPHFLEDETLLGGVIVRVGDRVMDGSLRRRLDDLRSGLIRGDAESPAL